jgi:hypothetical protein
VAGGERIVKDTTKAFLVGLVAGWLVACWLHPAVCRQFGGGNVMGNAGGFAGGNPGMPQGPGFYR